MLMERNIRTRASHAGTMLVTATMIFGLAAFAGDAAAQSRQPMVAFESFLMQRLFTTGPEVRMLGSDLDLIFPPEGEFTGKVVYKSGERVLFETPTRLQQRHGAMARLTFRGTNVQLGTENGPRSVEVYINDRLAGRLEFTLTRSESDDPFDPKTTWTVSNDPWGTHAYFTYDQDPAERQDIRFTYWSNTGELGGVPKGNLALAVKRNGKVVATSSAREISTADYLQKTQDLRTPDGMVFTAKSLAALCGPIVVELTHDGRVVTRFTGAVAKGTFVPHPLSAPDAPEPAHFLSPRILTEGGGGVSDILYSWFTR